MSGFTYFAADCSSILDFTSKSSDWLASKAEEEEEEEKKKNT